MDPQALAQTVLEIFRRNVTEHYFDMSGRVSRPEFWYFILGCFVASLAAAIIDAIARTGLLVSVVGLALLLPLAGMGARRLQDTGKPGSSVWIAIVPMAVSRVLAFLLALSGPLGLVGLVFLWPFLSLIGLVTLLGALWIGYLCAQPGVDGPNQYGPEPPKPPVPSAKPAT
jgi:uncharacterized membrane protein YhaH (DUF805 family)